MPPSRSTRSDAKIEGLRQSAAAVLAAELQRLEQRRNELQLQRQEQQVAATAAAIAAQALPAPPASASVAAAAVEPALSRSSAGGTRSAAEEERGGPSGGQQTPGSSSSSSSSFSPAGVSGGAGEREDEKAPPPPSGHTDLELAKRRLTALLPLEAAGRHVLGAAEGSGIATAGLAATTPAAGSEAEMPAAANCVGGLAASAAAAPASQGQKLAGEFDRLLLAGEEPTNAAAAPCCSSAASVPAATGRHTAAIGNQPHRERPEPDSDSGVAVHSRPPTRRRSRQLSGAADDVSQRGSFPGAFCVFYAGCHCWHWE